MSCMPQEKHQFGSTPRCRAAAVLVAAATAALLAVSPIAAWAQVSPTGAREEGGSSSGGPCVLPTIDGNLTDTETLANCLQPADGCGFVVVDPAKDICAPNSGFIPCDPSEACPAGGAAIYFANGSDLIRVIFAYDRASDTFVAGFRVVDGHAIGDADGGGSADDDCGAPGNIIDQAGIGLAEPYDVFIDTTCDGKPEYTVEVSGNALKVNGVVVPAGQGSFTAGGSNLELSV